MIAIHDPTHHSHTLNPLLPCYPPPHTLKQIHASLLPPPTPQPSPHFLAAPLGLFQRAAPKDPAAASKVGGMVVRRIDSLISWCREGQRHVGIPSGAEGGVRPALGGIH